MAVTDDEAATLRYYTRQHCSRQWMHFLAAMFAEFEERVDPAEADQFLETIGARIGRALPLRRCESLEELTGEVNAVLEGIEWGLGPHLRGGPVYLDYARSLSGGAAG